MWKEIFEQITFQSSKQSTGFNAIIETVQRKFSDLIDWDKEVSDNIILNTISYLSIPVIIIIDEFDKLNDDVKMRISNIMKLFSDTGKNITMIIVGVADDIQKLIAGHESIKRNIAEIKMPRMSIEELAEILNSRLITLNMTIDVNAKEKVVKLSQLLPEYIHAIGKGAAIYCNNRQNNCITKDDVMNSIKEFIKISDESSRLTYQKAVSSNQANTLFADVLLACAEVQCDDNGRFTQKSVVEPLSKIINRTMPIAGFQTHIAAFCTESRGNILERNGKERSFRYRFAEPRMQIYVLMNGILSNKVQW